MQVSNVLAHAEFAAEKMGKVDLVRGSELSAGLNCFEAGQEHRAHVHAKQDKLYYVLEGSGRLMIANALRDFHTGDVALAPAGVEHALSNPGPGRLVVLVVFAPPPAQR